MLPNKFQMLPKSRYTLVINGRPEGPFTFDRLKDLGLRPGDFVKTAEMIDYKEAHEIPELRNFFGFNKEPLIPQYFASFDQRLLASSLDLFFVSGICILLALLATLLTETKADHVIIALSLLAIIPVANLAYHIIMECSSKQGTYGKQILKIKVCDLEGYPITAAHATGRNLAKIFSVLTLFIGYLVSFFNKKQQALHDMIAGTLVMKDRLF